LNLGLLAAFSCKTGRPRVFWKNDILTFLGCSIRELDRILAQLRIPHWYRRQFTEQEARAVMAQFYFRRGRKGIADRREESGGRGSF
jgi:hypothetical protein